MSSELHICAVTCVHECMHICVCTHTFLKTKAWVPEKSFTVLKLRPIFFFFYEPGYKHVKFFPGIKFKENIVK